MRECSKMFALIKILVCISANYDSTMKRIAKIITFKDSNSF